MHGDEVGTRLANDVWNYRQIGQSHNELVRHVFRFDSLFAMLLLPLESFASVT